jgi:tripartite-type tricarboxylate transporter receptor subunit TctC
MAAIFRRCWCGARRAAKNVAEYVALAKSKPGSIDYASSGIGSIPHLAGELFNEQAGMKAVHVPYKGGAAVGHRPARRARGLPLCLAATAAPYLDSGRMRAIAVTGAKRSPFMKDVPTDRRVGFPGRGRGNWYAFVCLGQVPRPSRSAGTASW